MCYCKAAIMYTCIFSKLMPQLIVQYHALIDCTLFLHRWMHIINSSIPVHMHINALNLSALMFSSHKLVVYNAKSNF